MMLAASDLLISFTAVNLEAFSTAKNKKARQKPGNFYNLSNWKSTKVAETMRFELMDPVKDRTLSKGVV